MFAADILPEGSVTSPAGFRAGAVHTGLRPSAADDLAILLSDFPCSGAGVFTTNRVRAAPVLYDQALLMERPGRLRGIVMNAQNANACTGEQGRADTGRMASLAEQATDAPAGTFLVLSTGVIGVPLPMDRVEPGIAEAAARCQDDGGAAAARAIMTTDTVPKHLALRFETPAGVVTIGGIAKGSGMIHPDLATMLGVITTDAKVEPARVTSLIRDVADRTFNAITVDGDTSTNDSLIMLANGASEVEVARDSEAWATFEWGVEQVARHLALAIVRDGEGATRFIELSVTGATSDTSARTIGRVVARSSLVKTAWFGGDPNWGRVLAAAGSSGQPVDPDRLAMYAQVRDPDGGPQGDWVAVAEGGAPTSADPDELARIFAAAEIAIRLDVGVGGASCTVWTCDLSPEYVRINADYTT